MRILKYSCRFGCYIFIENNILRLNCCLYFHVRNQDGSSLEIDVDILLEFRFKHRYMSELERERPVFCPVFIMPSKWRSRRKKTVGESVHMQVPCPDALHQIAKLKENTRNQLLPLNTLTDLRLGSNNTFFPLK